MRHTFRSLLRSDAAWAMAIVLPTYVGIAILVALVILVSGGHPHA